MGLALKMCEIEQSYHRPFLVETLLEIETDGADSDGSGILVRTAAQALNCTVEDLTED
ncbi:hypothetical protein [Lactococcus allomyrinae]|uniref:hypothetical protein n=1 Tax=Lactococcus allomyrinae TaxID=2419773 RepID=UPI0013C4E734|nr:hypothetical protein [Lactococcus allomyrinae]